MGTTSKPDWQYVHAEKLSAPQVRRLYAERGVVIDGPVQSQLEQLSSGGFPSWTLYNLVRQHLLGVTKTSVVFACLKFGGTYDDLRTGLSELREELTTANQHGVRLQRIITEGAGPSLRVVADYNFRVDKLGSDISLTRDQEIAGTFRIKRLQDGVFLAYSFPKTRFDYRQMVELVEQAACNPLGTVIPYVPGPVAVGDSIHFATVETVNNFFLSLYTNGILGMECIDVFTADTFNWDRGFDYRVAAGAAIVRDRAEVIRRLRVEGQQLNLDTGRISQMLGNGYGIHHFGATFQGSSHGVDWQFPVEIKFVGRPLYAQISGGPLKRKAGDEWAECPGQETPQNLLVGVLEKLLEAMHGATFALPGAIRNVEAIPVD